jgi:hypothetical protein
MARLVVGCAANFTSKTSPVTTFGKACWTLTLRNKSGQVACSFLAGRSLKASGNRKTHNELQAYATVRMLQALGGLGGLGGEMTKADVGV